MEDYLYDSPPLIEVIAEIRWSFVPLASIPDGGVDPHFDKFQAAFTENAAKKDYSHIDVIVPTEIPKEFFAGKPVLRVRRGSDKWPLLQIGPGLLTVNLVPPYQGWAEFKRELHEALELLFLSYPDSNITLKMDRIHLRYLDAFTTNHGLGKYFGRFVHDGLRVGVNVPKEMADHVEGDLIDSISTSAQLTFSVKDMENTSGEIKFSPGTKGQDKERALISEFQIVKSLQNKIVSAREIESWFDEAHLRLRDWFEVMISDTTRRAFGARKNL